MKIKGLILMMVAMISSCMIAKIGVEYNEMTEKPSIEIINENLIAVNTDNSFKNSALSIYKIDYSVDTVNKVIHLYGFQAPHKKYSNRFEILIHGIGKIQLENFEYYWVDPDNKMTRIEKIKYRGTIEGT